jgi:anti-sigma B factor antagonist
MSNDELSVSITTEKSEGTLIFGLRGSLDIATAPAVRAALVEATGEGKHAVIVDLTQLEFLDSTGLGALIGAHRRGLDQGGHVRLVVRDGPIARLLNITGLVRVFAVYHSLAAAINDQDRVVATL